MKKLLAMLLVAVLVLASSSLCVAEGYNELLNMSDTYPVTNEPYTITAVAIYDSAITVDFEQYQSYWQWLEKETNVHVDFTLYANEAWNEQKAILLASGEYPDVFYVPFTNAEVYKYGVQQGLMLPLNEYLDDATLTPNINKVFEECPDLKAASYLPDGNIYGLGYYMTSYYETASGLRAQWIKQYAEAAGVDCTNIVTLDDLYEALKAIVAYDCNGDGVANEVGLSYYTSNDTIPAWTALIQYVMNAYGVVYDADTAVNTRTGAANYAPLTAEFKSALEYLNKLYSEGLLDEATFTQTEAEFQAKGVNGQMAFGIYYNCYADVPADIVTAHTENNYENEILYSPRPVVDDAANTPVVNGDYGIGVNRVCLSKDCKNPEIVIRWLDAQFTEISNLYYRAGCERGQYPDILDGDGWEWDEETTEVTTEGHVERLGYQNGGWYYAIEINNFAMGSVGYLGADDYRGAAYLHPEVHTAAANNWLTPYCTAINEYEVVGYPSFAVYYTDEQQEFVDTYVTDLNTYAFSNAAKFITGARSFEEYDAFIEELKAMEAEQYDTMISDIYTAFKG